MSGGHLCEAEVPTEPTGETAAPYEKLKYNSVGAGLCACPLLLLIIGFFLIARLWLKFILRSISGICD